MFEKLFSVFRAAAESPTPLAEEAQEVTETFYFLNPFLYHLKSRPPQRHSSRWVCGPDGSLSSATNILFDLDGH